MKIKFSRILLFIPASLILLFFVSCGSAVLPEIETPTPDATFEIPATPIGDTPTMPPISTASPVCPWENWPCPSDSLTMTAAMGTTLAAIPSNTPPSWATIIPAVGDLGWGSVYGKISDGVTMLPIEGATVKCEHSSYVSPYPCNGVTTTNADGIYSFVGVFFHDTDRITLIVEAPGYTSLRFKQDFFTQPEFHADLGLFPVTDTSQTPTPFIIMCTPPACLDGVLVCGDPNGCMAGCGAICLPATSTP